MVNVTVSNRVWIEARGLSDECQQALRDEFTHDNPDATDPDKKGAPLHVCTYQLVNENGKHFLTLPRGGMTRVREVLRSFEVDYGVQDARVHSPNHPALKDIVHRKPLRDYQQLALAKIMKRENALLRAPTGSGKTTVGIAAIAAAKVPTMIVVWATELLDQWVERIEEELGIPRNEIGIVGMGKFDVRPITVVMQQTVAHLDPEQIAEMANYFGMVIADEVHRFAAPTLFDAIDPWPARYRIGISADETRPDGKEFLVYDLFGMVAAEIPWQQLVDEGHVLEVDIMVVPTTFNDPEFKRDMARGGFFAKRAFVRLINKMTSDAERNDLIHRVALTELREGEQVMVLSHRVEHCRVIDRMINSSGYLCGTMLGARGAERGGQKSTRALVKDGTYRAVVGTVQVVGQGIDLPALGAAIITTPVRNKQQFAQVKGRVCRPAAGKTTARLYYMWDSVVYGRKTLKDLVKWNASVHVLEGDQWTPAREFIAR